MFVQADAPQYARLMEVVKTQTPPIGSSTKADGPVSGRHTGLSKLVRCGRIEAMARKEKPRISGSDGAYVALDAVKYPPVRITGSDKTAEGSDEAEVMEKLPAQREGK